MAQYPSTNSEDRESTLSSSIAEQQSSNRFDTFSLEELLQIVDDGMDTDGAPLNNNDLHAIQVRIVSWRRLQNEVQGAKNDLKRRGRADDDVIEGVPGKRIDIKYDEVDLLTLKSSFRAWTDWKADLERVWAGATWKYQRDNLKIQGCLENGQGLFETTVYEEYEKATQRNNQSPVDFDAYLSSIERELPEVPDSVQANRFYAKLNEDVVKQIKISGLQTLPNTPTGMVALAQRVWEGLRLKRNTPVSEVKINGSSTLPGQSQRPRPWNKLYNGRPGRQSSGDKSTKIEKQEPTCYLCGELGHIKPDCRHKDEQTKSKSKPRIQQQRVAQRNQASSDEDSSENE
ncbi:hypothetical protein V1505DRAFT_417614 [Lipomyces doorenjongii]